MNRLLHLLAPHWVDLQAAWYFSRVAQQATPRILALTSQHLQAFTGQRYLSRAYDAYDDIDPPWVLTVAGGNEHALLDDLICQICEEARQKSMVIRTKKGKEDVITYLAGVNDAWFVLLPPLEDENVVMELAKVFPRLVFVLPTLDQAPNGQGLGPWIWVQPRLEAAEELRHFEDYDKAWNSIMP